MRTFVGRRDLLGRLEREWEAVRKEGEGRMITIRGRRRVGKTWLVEEFIDRVDPPSVFFAASRQTPERELTLFARTTAASSLPARDQVEGVGFETWQAALVAAGAGAQKARPSVIVLDEFPYLLGETRSSREPVLGAVQAAWDRVLSKRPVLLILIGSDQAMMEVMTAPRQPLHQRPSRELIVPPLDPAETAALSGLTGADALDSYLVTGGFPKIVRAKMDQPLSDFLRDQLADDGTPLVTTGRLILDSEFGTNKQARSILSVLGEGLRKRADISRDTGIDAANLKRPLDFLIDEKRVVEKRQPLSGARTRDTRYQISDPFLRFYMRFIDRYRGEIERARGRMVAGLVRRDWSAYRGKAIEPIIRSALEEIVPDERFGDAAVVGAYWTNDNAVEVDLVGADRRDPPARRIAFVGSVKWRQRGRIGKSDYSALMTSAFRIPGVEPSKTRTVAVSRYGADASAAGLFDVDLDADDILRAWSAG